MRFQTSCALRLSARIFEGAGVAWKKLPTLVVDVADFVGKLLVDLAVRVTGDCLRTGVVIGVGRSRLVVGAAIIVGKSTLVEFSSILTT